MWSVFLFRPFLFVIPYFEQRMCYRVLHAIKGLDSIPYYNYVVIYRIQWEFSLWKNYFNLELLQEQNIYDTELWSRFKQNAWWSWVCMYDFIVDRIFSNVLISLRLFPHQGWNSGYLSEALSGSLSHVSASSKLAFQIIYGSLKYNNTFWVTPACLDIYLGCVALLSVLYLSIGVISIKWCKKFVGGVGQLRFLCANIFPDLQCIGAILFRHPLKPDYWYQV